MLFQNNYNDQYTIHISDFFNYYYFVIMINFLQATSSESRQ
jgi:hypothetical protein